MRRLSAEATAIAAAARRPRGGRAGRGRAPARLLGPGPPRAPAGRLDAAAARRPRGRRPRADPAGPRLAGRRPAGGRRPDRGRGPGGGVRGRRRGAAPAAVPVERRGLAGDAGAARRPPGRRRAAGRPRRCPRGSCPRGSPRPSTTRSSCWRSAASRPGWASWRRPPASWWPTNPERPAWRAGLATLLCDTGRPDEARERARARSADGFADDPARRRLDDRGHAAGRRRRRARRRRAGARRSTSCCAPYARRNVVIGHGGGVPGPGRPLSGPAGACDRSAPEAALAHLRAGDRRQRGAAAPRCSSPTPSWTTRGAAVGRARRGGARAGRAGRRDRRRARAAAGRPPRRGDGVGRRG